GEYPIHTRIMARRPDVNAVVHTHAPAAVTFGALVGVPLRPVSHYGAFFPDGVPRFDFTTDTIRTYELGERVADAIGDGDGLLLVNHGLVAVGADVETATMAAVILERACRDQLAAIVTGLEHRWTDREEALVKREHIYGDKTMRER